MSMQQQKKENKIREKESEAQLITAEASIMSVDIEKVPLYLKNYYLGMQRQIMERTGFISPSSNELELNKCIVCNFSIICWTDVLSLVLWTAVWSFGKHWLWMKILLFAISECWMHEFDFFRFHSCKHLFDLFNPCESCSLNLALYELISCCLSSLPETLLSSCVTTGYQGFILFVMSFWCNRGTIFSSNH